MPENWYRLSSFTSHGLHDVSKVRILLIGEILKSELRSFGLVLHKFGFFLPVLVPQNHEQGYRSYNGDAVTTATELAHSFQKTLGYSAKN